MANDDSLKIARIEVMCRFELKKKKIKIRHVLLPKFSRADSSNILRQNCKKLLQYYNTYHRAEEKEKTITIITAKANRWCRCSV